MLRSLVHRCIVTSIIILPLSLAAAASTVTLHNFAGGTGDGAYPNGALISDAAGNLYGTTWSGGNSASCKGGCGTVFRLSPSAGSWTESIVYNFQGAPSGDGANPWGAFVADAAGNFYGVTASGGARNEGSVYEL